MLRSLATSCLRSGWPALAIVCGCGAVAPSPKARPAPIIGPGSPVRAPVTEIPEPSAPKPLAGALRLQLQNPLAVPREHETVSVRLADLERILPSLQTAKLVVQSSTQRPVLSQWVDSDGDERIDELVFQTDFAANESKLVWLGEGTRAPVQRDAFKVYGRFVRERHDDFAWENDHIAHRVYGPGLETWAQEPLTSSGIDVWVKRTPELVIDGWYQLDDYHRDNGQGGDFYSVGRSRGCGGIGVWDGTALRASRNFTVSRVLANGPIRLIFELEYAPWDVGAGVRVTETKRVVVDAGQHFNRMRSSLRVTGTTQPVSVGIGIAKHDGAVFDADLTAGTLRSWEPISGNHGHLGCAVIGIDRARFSSAETPSDRLLLTQVTQAAPVDYLVGTAWDQAGDVPDASAWSTLVSRTANAARTPIVVSSSPDSVERHGAALSWSERVADSLITAHPDGLTDKWEYDSGLVLKGMLAIWEKTHDAKYFEYVKRSVDRLLTDDGAIRGYRPEEHNLDAINAGKLLFPLFAAAKDDRERARYRHALDSLRAQLAEQPRTRDGAFWHKQIYPHQLWLDGIYMASPFLAEYARTFAEPAALNDVATQILLAERHLRDPKTGLLYHGWDETHAERWANPNTGTSSQFWGRSVGWYAMAVVDVLELLPARHPQRAALRGVLERLSTAVVAAQDPSGVWWQVLDAPRRDKNFREASASAMFVYALAKAVRLHLLEPARFTPAVERGARGLLEQFASFDEREHLHLKNICKVAGLGGKPYRDGSYAYYTSTEISDDDPKGVGAFILAMVETR